MVNTKTKVEGEHVGARVTLQEMKKLDALVEAGAFLNRSDAVRTAIREMLRGLKVIPEKNISLEQAKKDIINYLEKNSQAYPSDIADALEMDYDLVLQALQELKKSGDAEND